VAPIIAAPTSAAPAAPTNASAEFKRVVGENELLPARRALRTTNNTDYTGFDRAAYIADPAAYLGRVVGGRCWEVANPAPDVAALAPAGATGFSVATGNTAVLSASTEPGMPVTYTSFGLGSFDGSGLHSISVAAGADGIAHASFRVTPGTVGSCLITAGSPVRANTLQFIISIPEGAP